MRRVASGSTTTSRQQQQQQQQQQACAACKCQRRKCAPDCILAPYFPHDRQRQFLNAHKLFGVSNITKIIRNLQTPARDEAMRTIIIQSDVRAHDPVGGCHRIIRELERQIEYNKAELELVLHQLAICRAQSHQQQLQQHYNQRQQQQQPRILNDSIPNNCDNSFNGNAFLNYQQTGEGDEEQQEQKPELQVEDHLEDPNTWVMQDSLSTLNIKQYFVDVNESCGEDDLKPLLEVPIPYDAEGEENSTVHVHELSDKGLSNEEDRAILEAEEAYIQHVQDHDLKGAATLFTLTNCHS